MKTSDLILTAREDRLQNIQRYLDQALICVKANIPGKNKQINNAYLLVRIFKNEIINKIKVFDISYFDSYDGPYYLIKVENNLSLKKQLIELEETHPLGRFIDLDFFSQSDKSVYRSDFNLPPRRCYLCGEYALICSRNKTHSLSDLLKHINTEVERFFDNLIEELIDFAIMKELNLDDKFGLVTPTTSGSHPDMTYSLMIEAKLAIIPGLKKMFWIGYHSDDLSQCIIKAKRVGMTTEKAMYHATNNINCYKGLIFILGYVLTSAGYVVKHHQDIDDIFTNVKVMAKDVYQDMNYQTFGEKAYHEYQFGGARGEAFSGLMNVRKAYECLDLLDDENLHITLIKIIENADDSVMLKRAGSIVKYHYYKNLITSIKNYDLAKIQHITNECIKANISCGGAADILIAAIFICRFAKIYKK